MENKRKVINLSKDTNSNQPLRKNFVISTENDSVSDERYKIYTNSNGQRVCEPLDSSAVELYPKGEEPKIAYPVGSTMNREITPAESRNKLKKDAKGQEPKTAYPVGSTTDSEITPAESQNEFEEENLIKIRVPEDRLSKKDKKQLKEAEKLLGKLNYAVELEQNAIQLKAEEERAKEERELEARLLLIAEKRKNTIATIAGISITVIVVSLAVILSVFSIKTINDRPAPEPEPLIPAKSTENKAKDKKIYDATVNSISEYTLPSTYSHMFSSDVRIITLKTSQNEQEIMCMAEKNFDELHKVGDNVTLVYADGYYYLDEENAIPLNVYSITNHKASENRCSSPLDTSYGFPINKRFNFTLESKTESKIGSEKQHFAFKLVSEKQIIYAKVPESIYSKYNSGDNIILDEVASVISGSKSSETIFGAPETYFGIDSKRVTISIIEKSSYENENYSYPKVIYRDEKNDTIIIEITDENGKHFISKYKVHSRVFASLALGEEVEFYKSNLATTINGKNANFFTNNIQ